MFWAIPAGIRVAPLLALGLAAFVLLADPLGLESALAGRLFAAYAQSAPAPGPLHPLLPLRLMETLWLLVFGGGAIALLPRGPVWSALPVMAGTSGAAWGAWLLFRRFGILFDAATTGAGLLLLFAVMIASWALAQLLSRARLRMAFADSLPTGSIERIARHPSLLKTDGDIRDCTYLVCGLRGLPVLRARFHHDPAAFTALLRRVLGPLMDQALAHGGTLDQVTAGSFAAFWNAPLQDADHAAHACDAANSMMALAARVNETLAEQRGADGHPMPQVEIGIGLASGSVIAGAFGALNRMGYSVEGEAVTLAQRIQGLSRQYGPSVIVSEATRDAAERGFAFLEVDTVALGPDDPPVRLYALAGTPVLKASPKFRALTTFHDHIFQALRKQQWGQARQLIEQCRKLSGASPRLYELHLRRIGQYEAAPPGENWDGAFRPIAK